MACTYRFKDAAGQDVTLSGKAAMKAALAEGTLDHLLPPGALTPIAAALTSGAAPTARTAAAPRATEKAAPSEALRRAAARLTVLAGGPDGTPHVVRDPDGNGGQGVTLASFEIGATGRPVKIRHAYEHTRDVAQLAIDQWLAENKPAARPRSAAQAAGSAVKNTAAGLNDAIAGLGRLFGGKGRLSSGLSFDEQTYEQAKPLFMQAIAHFQAAGTDLKEAMRAIVRMVLDQFGADAAGNMKPYVVRFMSDVRDGKINYDNPISTEREQTDDRGTESQGGGALAGVATQTVGEPAGGGRTGSDADAQRPAGGEGDPRVDGARRATGRGRGDRPAAVHPADAGESGQPGGRGTGRGVGADRSGDAGSLPAEQPRGARPAAAVIPAADFVIGADVALGSGGQMVKYRDNIAAIKTLKKLEAERRRATPEEQRVLARYVGWGGIPNAFRNPATGEVSEKWEPEVAELEALLSPNELRRASASVLNAHYTAQSVVSFMWRAAERLGFNGGLVLEPSVGSGNFIGLMPESLRGHTHVTGIELDSLTARIAGALYPRSNIIQSGFEKLPLPDNQFDLAIGNPPFGKVQLRFPFKPELNGSTIHNQFFRGSMDTVRPGGLQIMVVSRYLLDAQDTTTRTALAQQARLLGAIRLPGSAFKGNALTEVVTDILFLQRRDPAEEAQVRQAFAERHKKVPASEPATARAEREQRNMWLTEALDWVETATLPDPAGGEPITINRYFALNPQMIAGTLDRSGSMRRENDIDVKLPAGTTLDQALDARLALLPSLQAVPRSAEINARTQEMHRALGESLALYASGAEVGAIRFDDDGALTQVIERIGANGETVIKKITLTPDTPWSPQLAMGLDGKWFREVAQTDATGKKVKAGAKGTRNVYVREVFENEADIPPSLRMGKSAFERLKKLVTIRDHLVAQLALETGNATPQAMEENRAKLRTAYEAFVKEHGYISEPKNAGVVSDMPDEGLLLSLENGFKREVTASKAAATGMKQAPASAKPAAILSRPVGIPPARLDRAESINDALAICLSESGRLDVERIAHLRGTSPEAVAAELTAGETPLAYADPEQGMLLVDKNEYLSGNVRRKLEAAREAKLDKNISALEAVQPTPWTSDQVTAKIGAAWIPPEVYAEFVDSLLDGKSRVTFARLTNTFQVYAAADSAKATSTWGTARMPAPELIQAILNSRRVAIYDTDSDGNRHFNQTETDAALDKRREIIEAFDDWIFKDSDRRRLLTQRFNDAFNVRVNRQHDGSHMTFPGKVPDDIIKLRRGQINAIWRGVVENFVLYDHAVGAGKTFTGIARAIERRRMGLSKKPMVVVPNHLVKEWLIQAYRLYPGAKILAAGKNDLSTKNRRRLFAKIATGEWDLVIVPHSSFQFISLSPETEERFLMRELEIANSALKEAEAEQDPNSRFKSIGVKEAEALITRLEGRIDKVRARARDKLLTFEQMGIDDLTVDESHEFKNLQYSSNLSDVRGMGSKAGSAKALDMYMKARLLHEQNGSIAFMTGTPISNSAVEMYTILRYLAPKVLEEMGLENFDAFRLQSVEATAKLEPTDSGTGLKMVTRLGRSWSNMRALMDAYYSVADVVTNDDIKAWYAEDNPGQEFPLPKVKGGMRRAISVTPTPAQQAALDVIISGFNSLDGIEDVQERNAERLRLMDRARKVSLHAKAVDPALEDEPGGKLDRAVQEVARIYRAWDDDKGTQLVFLDRGVPKSKGDSALLKDYDAARAAADAAVAAGDEEAFARANERLEKFDAAEMAALREAQAGGWNAYQHIKDGLIAAGIPAHEIAFIQSYNSDADKEALFGAVRDGSVRVLIGSTPRMGAGTNVQERLVGLHHIDATWKPSDIEQREGRIIRQGNALYEKYGNRFEVEILAYVTERTVDAKLWELNSMKLRMINAIRYYDGAFEMDFEDNDAVGMAEIAAIASGDPLLLERFKLMAEVDQLYRQMRSFQRRKDAAQDALDAARKSLANDPAQIESIVARARAAQGVLDAAARSAGNRSLTMMGQTYESASAAQFALEQEIQRQRVFDEKAPIEIDINGKLYTSRGGAGEAIADILGDAEPFFAEAGGETIVRRAEFARAMKDVLGSGATSGARVPDRPVGTMLGIPVFANGRASQSGRSYFVELFGALPTDDAAGKVVISGERDITPEKYRPGDPIPVNVVALRPVITAFERQLQTMADAATWRVRDLQQRMQRAAADIPALEAQMKETFKHADALAQKTERLRTVEAELSARVSATPPADGAPEAAAQEVTPSAPDAPPTGAFFMAKYDAAEYVPDAKPITLDALPDAHFFTHRDDHNRWSITEAKTGLRIAGPTATRKEAVETANQRIQATGADKIRDLIANKPLSDEKKLEAWREYRQAGGVKFSRAGALARPLARDLGIAEDQADVAILNNDLAEHFNDDRYRNAYAQVRVSDADAQTLAAVARAFGARPVAIAPNSGLVEDFEGIRTSRNPGVLYVRVPSRNLIALTGHELYHDLAATRPELHQWMLGHLVGHVRNFDAFVANLNRNLPEADRHDNYSAAEELLADFTGDALMDPAFLERLANDNPGRFTQLLTAIKQWLNRLLARLRGNGSEQFIDDVKTLRDRLAEVLRAYAETGRVRSLPAQELWDDVAGGNLPGVLRNADANGNGLASGVEAPMAERTARRILASFKNAPRLFVAARFADLPPEIQQDARNQESDERTTKGVLHDDVLYVVANTHSTLADLEETVFHELIGHYGMRELLGPKVMQKMNAFYTSLGGAEGLLRIAKENGFAVEFISYIEGLKEAHAKDPVRYRIEMVQRILMEEVFAHLAQKNPGIQTRWERLVGAVREWLREHGFERLARMNNRDIAYLIGKARRTLERGPGGGPRGGATPPAARKDVKAAGQPARPDMIEVDGKMRPTTNSNGKPIHPTEEGIRNFWRWFGDGQIVDEQGRPIVLYHGSKAKVSMRHDANGNALRDANDDFVLDFENAPISEFKESADGALGKGVYVSTDAEQATTYAGIGGVVYPLYANGKFIRSETFGVDGTNGTVKPEQIKSATGNNGDFDPDQAPIVLRRSVSELAADTRTWLTDTFSRDTSETFNWWHKTVGSQFHKAKVDPHFRRVYEKAQQFIDDVARYGTESADLAPDLLPKMDTMAGALREFWNAKRDGRDAKAIAAPIFDGTLYEDGDQKGKVWTDAELRDRYGLNERQIDLYRQFRRAVDHSLEVMAKAEMRKTAKIHELAQPEDALGEPAKSLSMEDLANFYHNQYAGKLFELRQKYDAHTKMFEANDRLMKDNADRLKLSREQYYKSKALSDATYAAEQAAMTKEIEALETLEKAFLEKTATIRKLQREGYAPLMRFGRYTVDVVGSKPLLDDNGNQLIDEETGELMTEPDRIFFSMFESEREARAAERILAEEYPDAVVTRGVASEDSYQLFGAVNPGSLEMLARLAGKDDEIIQQFYKQAVSSRSALKRLIHRQGIAGYSTDVSRSLASFLMSNARATASADHFGELLEAAADIPKHKGDVADEAVKLINYIRDPNEEAGSLRGLLFMQYLGGSVAAAMVNLTQTMTTTAPYMHQFGGTVGELMRASSLAAQRMAGKNPAMSNELADALTKAEDEGVVAPHNIHALMGATGGQMLTQNRFLRMASHLWGSMFGMAEQFNRETAFIAAYNRALALGPDGLRAAYDEQARIAAGRGLPPPSRAPYASAYAFAKDAVNQTQFVLSKAARPNWARGAVGATLFTFKQFSVMYLELFKRLPNKERALMLGILIVLAGVGGAPGADDLDDLIDTIGQALGYNTNAKRWKDQVAIDVFGQTGGDFVMSGVSAFLPLELSARLGMGNLIPASGILKKSTTGNHEQAYAEIMGAAGGFGKSLMDAWDYTLHGRYGMAAAQGFLPKALKDITKGADMAATGIYNDAHGRRVTDVDGGDALVKMIGFQPSKVAGIQRVKGQEMQDIALTKAVKATISEIWATGIHDRDAEQSARARAMLAEWNEKNPETPITINAGAVLRRVQQMRMTAAERMEKTAPKEMRANVRAAFSPPEP